LSRKKAFKGSLEPQVYKGLRAFQGANKFKIDYETETIKYRLEKTYIPDFIITFKDGRKIYIEAKGFLRPENRAQLLAVKSQYPDIDLRLVFERDNKLRRTSTTRYSDWATQKGFKFSIGNIPSEWFE